MRILIVEDEHKIAHTLRQGLEQERFIVDLAYDGEEGFDLSTSEDYDLIVLDRMLPGMDGLELCAQLRKQNNHTPVLMLTARVNIADRVDGLNNGADDYLTKPFAFEELLARIKALLRRPNTLASSELHVDDLILDTTTYEVKRAGTSIILSAKEFALLEYLLRHRGKTVTKEQIINHVWNYDATILPNTVEVFIRYLRNKIDRPFHDKKPLIQTVRGFGYKIEG